MTSFESLSGDPFDGTKGCYVSVSVLQDPEIRLPVNLPWSLGSDLHCTIVYSRESAPSYPEALYDVDDKTVYIAKLVELEYWDGHDNDGYLVAKLDCPELNARNKFWIAKGCKHSFDDYTPHVTLAKNFLVTDQLRDMIASFNIALKRHPIEYKLGNETIENING